MKATVFLAHTLTDREKRFGTCYLLFETLFFASLLQGLNLLLGSPLSQPQVNILFFTVNFLAVLWIFRNYLLAQIASLPKLFGRIVLASIGGFVAYWILNILMTWLIFSLDPHFFSINDATIQKLAAEDFYPMLFGTVILVPITEECLFRGLVFRGLYDHGPVLAWSISIAVFSAIHIVGYIGAYPSHTILLCFLQYIPAGICLAGAYRLGGSLLSPILIHAAVNLIGMLSVR